MVATQQPGISAPLSLLINPSIGVVWMWIASLIIRSGEFLAWSNTEASTVFLLSWTTPIAIMYLKLRNLLNIQAMMHVNTIKEMSIQLRNLWRDFYQGRNLWSDCLDF